MIRQKTSIRLEDYIPRRGSTENLSEYQILDGKLPCGDANAETEFLKYDPSKLEDWDLGDIGNCELNQRQRRPLEVHTNEGMEWNKKSRLSFKIDI